MDKPEQDNNSKTEDSVFLLRVQFRRNASWQGTLQSMKNRKTCIFRSVLELGSLMHNERIGAFKLEKDAKYTLPDWESKEDVS